VVFLDCPVSIKEHRLNWFFAPIWHNVHIMNDMWSAVYCAKPRKGKCQPAGSLVLMADGSWKKIEEVAIGDKVLSPTLNGKAEIANVVSTNFWFSDENYCFKNLKGDVLFNCSSNHLVPVTYRTVSRKVSNRSLDRVLYLASDLYKKTKATFHFHNINLIQGCFIESFSEPLSLPVDPYILGVFLGDGCFYYNDTRDNKNGQIKQRLSITSMDTEIIEAVSEKYSYMSSRKKQNQQAHEYDFSINGFFAKHLTLLGLRGFGSGTKFVPSSYKKSFWKHRLELLAGLIDTDGFVSSKGGIEITLKSKRLIDDICFITRSLGGKARLVEVKKKCGNNGVVGIYYKTYINLGKMSKYLFLRCKRKRDRFSLFCNKKDVTHRRFFIEKISACKVYGFTLDSSQNLYITDNFVVTHNSWLTLSHAYTLDRGQNDEPRFPVDCDRVYFSAGSFAKGLAKKYPAGTAFILDDAGLNLFSREAMTRTVIDVAKIFQSIRFKNYIILLSLPAYNMLDKAIRTLMCCYIQPNSIDPKSMMVRAGVRHLKYDPHDGIVYRRKPIRVLKDNNTWLNYEVRQHVSVNEVWFDAPPKELRVAYEEKKAKCLGDYYDSVAKDII